MLYLYIYVCVCAGTKFYPYTHITHPQQTNQKQVLRLLEQAKSTYCSTFTRLAKEVFTARLEANDNTKYLRTLEACALFIFCMDR